MEAKLVEGLVGSGSLVLKGLFSVPFWLSSHTPHHCDLTEATSRKKDLFGLPVGTVYHGQKGTAAGAAGVYTLASHCVLKVPLAF